MKRLYLILALVPLWSRVASAFVVMGSAPSSYMVENTSGTDPSGNFCYDFQTSPSCSARITNLTATISSTSLPSGSTQYIQNTLTPTTATQQFSVLNATFTNHVDISTLNVTGALLLNSQAGTSGQVVTSQGAGVPPKYTTITATPGGTANAVQFNSGGTTLGGSTTTINSCGYVTGTLVQVKISTSVAATTSSGTAYTVTTTSTTINMLCSTDRVEVRVDNANLEDANAGTSSDFASLFKNGADLSNAGNGFCEANSGVTTTNTRWSCSMGYLDLPGTTAGTSYAVFIKSSSAGAATWNIDGLLTVISIKEYAN
jgi:hypothetical protein